MTIQDSPYTHSTERTMYSAPQAGKQFLIRVARFFQAEGHQAVIGIVRGEYGLARVRVAIDRNMVLVQCF